ncbi:hypothetical protein AMECASPLE_036443 [Ameca splendens]|uniref:Uncharacterized protein n=1 Tax=Ameca splendens TaxID=208324 RepID=A0ABV0ZT97_9TELE
MSPGSSDDKKENICLHSLNEVGAAADISNKGGKKLKFESFRRCFPHLLPLNSVTPTRANRALLNPTGHRGWHTTGHRQFSGRPDCPPLPLVGGLSLRGVCRRDSARLSCLSPILAQTKVPV